MRTSEVIHCKTKGGAEPKGMEQKEAEGQHSAVVVVVRIPLLLAAVVRAIVVSDEELCFISTSVAAPACEHVRPWMMVMTVMLGVIDGGAIHTYMMM